MQPLQLVMQGSPSNYFREDREDVSTKSMKSREDLCTKAGKAVKAKSLQNRMAQQLLQGRSSN